MDVAEADKLVAFARDEVDRCRSSLKAARAAARDAKRALDGAEGVLSLRLRQAAAARAAAEAKASASAPPDVVWRTPMAPRGKIVGVARGQIRAKVEGREMIFDVRTGYQSMDWQYKGPRIDVAATLGAWRAWCEEQRVARVRAEEG